MSQDEEDIILADLPDDELVEQMFDDLYDGLADEIAEGTQILLDRGWDAKKVLDEALVGGMNIVGIDFRDGILFVPEVLLAANSMKAGMALLQPILSASGAEPVGKMVIGTVKGDIHDIGKNLVGMMMEGAGFEVVDLGINTDAETYIAALKEHRPNILGMSALLTTTMPYMKVVIDTMKDEGLRDDFIVLVGGAPLNEEFGEAVGATPTAATRRPRSRLRNSWSWKSARPEVAAASILVIACGALAHEIVELQRLNGWTHIKIQCLPAKLHNRPEKIPAAVAQRSRNTRTSTNTCLSPTPTAARAGRWTRCSRSTALSACPAHIATSSIRGRTSSRPCQRTNRHVLPD